jgi:enoyl-CoA hydratase
LVTAAVLFRNLVSITRQIEALPCPTVFAGRALCLTWGFELALACALIVAAPQARFGLDEATVGLTPAMGGTQRLAARAGIGRAREYVMTAGRYDATTLYAARPWCSVDIVDPPAGRN